ncbi:hypothetical protein HYPSUDRAFT_197489 [Hypholoma sublateritium FD-334 SS-4]|uniref:Uncharacterized protein n=1 Tax=Hypholoma sublateritium (strain FD-334 SS-4) TaxID=945553 RepID=A0A0D2LJN7_HYPSF|nr:hypothetical protein HYPSUDRAFT_197489 [Hypholoma sublateritium FD-334 SS-4]
MGRAIRRLVSLYESLDDLLQAADDHNTNENEENDEAELLTEEAQERLQESESRFAAFTVLIQVLPSVGKAIEDPSTDMDMYLTQLQKAYAPNPPLNTKCRSDRGMQNDITGRLLCPIEYDWDDESVRNEIRAGTINISEDYFLRCFYPYGIGDPDNVEKGFLRSGLLVKTYSSIFISPSSSESFSDEDENGAARKQQRVTNSQKKATKSNVANILGMDGRVTPRSIAYAAVLLAFNLTNAGYWMEVFNQFNFRALYALVVDFFEGPSGQAARRRSQNLLKWWSTQIFPHHSSASTNSRKSRNKLLAQRAAREESVPL